MITRHELVLAREKLLERAVSFFAGQPGITGIFLAGSLADGSADAYSDIDLRIIAAPDAHARLVEGRLEWPAHWGDLLFNEWLNGTQHCVSHFRPFLKIDVFCWTPDTFTSSPWFKMPARVYLDREGLVQAVLRQSQSLTFPPPPALEVSRILSKALAGAHEVVRRARRGELCFAHSLLDELRGNMIRLDAWLHGVAPMAPEDPKLARRVSPALAHACERSYVGLSAADVDDAVVTLCRVLARQIPDLHRMFALERSLEADRFAVALVTERQVA